jgi:competence protein ComEC
MVSNRAFRREPGDFLYCRPVIPLLFAFIAGILFARYLPGHATLAALGAVVAAGVMGYALYLKRNPSFLPLILYACLGYLAFFSWIGGASASDHVTRYLGERPWRITGIVASDPVADHRRQKWVLNRLTLALPSRNSPPFSVKGSIQVAHYGKPAGVSAGDRITLVGRIRPFTNFNNPGGFDYQRYMAFRRIQGRTYAIGNSLQVLEKNSVAFFQAGLNAARTKIAELISRASEGEAQSVLNALILGKGHEVPAELRQAFNRAGVSHLLAISGLHIGIVASFAFLFFRWLVAFFPPVLWHAWIRKAAALLSILPVIVYGLLAGMSPSTQRAVIMVIVFLLSLLLEREHDLVNTLAVAAFAILIVNPVSIFSISFQLSFTAVLSIIYGMPRVQERLKNRHPAVRWVLGFILVSFFANLGTLPLVMYYFNYLSIAGVFSNLILIPLIGFVAVPAGLFSVLVLSPVSMSAAAGGLKISGFVLSHSIALIHAIAGLPFSAFKTVTPSILEIACFYVLLWGLLNLRASGCKTMPFENRGMRRLVSRTNAARILVALMLVVFSADAFYWIKRRLWHADFRVTVLDVGQGNAALLEMPKGYCALIDGGGFTDNAIFDVGELVVAPYLWRNKIRTVDMLILTHPDADHLNGLIYILKHFHVKQVISNHQEAESIEYQSFKDLIHAQGVFHPQFAALPRRMNINGVTLEILHPAPDFKPSRCKPGRSFNDNSLIIKAGFNHHSILFPGDIGKPGERNAVAKAAAALHSTILLAPHHGSKTSSTPAFLKAVDPEVVIISCGGQNRFGFPAAPVLKRYQDLGLTVFRTDEHGAVRLVFDEKSAAVFPETGPLRSGFRLK